MQTRQNEQRQEKSMQRYTQMSWDESPESEQAQPPFEFQAEV
jgi:hypothetical protein